MKRRTAALRAASNLIAVEPRMLFDGAGAATADAVIAGPDAPDIVAESPVAVREDHALWFDGLLGETDHAALVSISDADDDGGIYQFNLSVSHGRATVAEVVGATVIGNGTDCVQLAGTLDAVNQSLAGLRFDPTQDFSGQASIALAVSDPDWLCDDQTIEILVSNFNRAPVAGDDVREFALGSVSVSGNVINAGHTGEQADFDPDGDPFGVYGLAVGDVAVVPIDQVGVPVQGQWGELQIENDGSYVYRPGAQLADLGPGESRTDVFTYLICDPDDAVDTATLSFVIRGVDPGSGLGSPPSAADDYRSTVEGRLLDDGQAILGNDLGDAADTDPDGDVLRVVGAAAGSDASIPFGRVGEVIVGQWGELRIQADGAYSYAPSATTMDLRDGDFVQDPFTYTVADAAGHLDTAIISICVAGIDGALLARPDLRTIAEPDPDVDATVLGNVVSAGADGEQADLDSDGDPITVQGVIAGTSLLPIVSSSGPDAAFEAVAGAYGRLIMRTDGSYAYRPGPAAQSIPAGTSLDDVFSYTINDGTGRTSVTTLTIRIVGENDAPLARPDANSIAADQIAPVSGNVITGGSAADQADSDSDAGDVLKVTGTPSEAVVAGTIGMLQPGQAQAGQYGTLLVAEDGGYSYQVDTTRLDLIALGPGEVLQDRFTVTIADSAGATSSSTLIVNVVGVNNPPSAPTLARVIPGNARFGDPASQIDNVPPPTDPDLPAQALSVTITNLPDAGNGQFVLPDGQPLAAGASLPAAVLQTLAFVPATTITTPVDASGLIQAGALNFLVDDGNGGTAPGAISIAIRPAVAVAPIIEPGVSGGGGGSGPGSSVPGLTPPVLIDPLVKPSDSGGGSQLPTDPFSPFGPQGVLGMVEVAEGLGDAKERATRLANAAIAAEDDCEPQDPAKPLAKPKPRIVPRAALTEFARPKAKRFSEQVDTEKKRFHPPAKVKVRAKSGRQC